MFEVKDSHDDAQTGLARSNCSSEKSPWSKKDETPSLSRESSESTATSSFLSSSSASSSQLTNTVTSVIKFSSAHNMTERSLKASASSESGSFDVFGMKSSESTEKSIIQNTEEDSEQEYTKTSLSSQEQSVKYSNSSSSSIQEEEMKDKSLKTSLSLANLASSSSQNS
eukprot:IDg17434t1